MRKLLMRSALTAFCFLIMTQSANAAQLLVPGGQVIGLQLQDGTVCVEGFDPELGEDAKEAGLETGDYILSVDGSPVTCAQDIRLALQRSDGDVDLTVRRGKSTRQLELEPRITPDGPRLGIYLKEGITGIGTVTYYDPQSGSFGALGHGVNRPDGDPIFMTEGKAYYAAVDAVRKGKAGDPGQLMGTVTDTTPFANLDRNMPQGVFGIAKGAFSGDALPVATVSEIRTGPAAIRSTTQNGTIREYSVEILKVYPGSGADGRNMLLQVTDPALLSTTGGIVQGMSGSPILQDGKLVGAVTHVLVNDPTTGYGIFIENMLDAAA